MDKIVLNKEKNIIDYFLEHQDECKSRKIYTDKAMVDKLIKLTPFTFQKGKEIKLLIKLPTTAVKIELLREGTNCYWFKNIKSKDIQQISPVDKTKEPIYIINEPNYEKYENICK